MAKELNPKDKEALATLYDHPSYLSLRKYLENERFNISTKLLLVPATDVAQIARFQGQAAALKELHLQIKKIHSELSKEA